MNALATTREVTGVGGAAAPAVQRRTARIYWLEAKCEVRKVVRLPAYLGPMLAFPAMFYLLFGVALRSGSGGGGGGRGGALSLATYLLATYGAWGVMNVSIFGFGVGVATERGQGWLLLKRATPMPPLANLVGRLASSALFSAAVVATLFLLGVGPGGVRMPFGTFLELGAVLVAGSLPFAAFGLVIGYWAGPNSAPMVCNLLSLPMSFASGLWIPLAVLPPVVQRVAHFLPAYHYARLALGVLGAGSQRPLSWSVLYLVAFTAVMLFVARLGYQRDEGRTFG